MPILESVKSQLSQASSFLDIAKVFATLFRVTIPGQDPPKVPDEYKNENSDYGLKVSGIKTRERLNEQAREILDRVKKPEDLSEADQEVLKQYSGRGGLTDNSQFEYYTPQHVAEGCWDSLTANGFNAGNVLDPSTGHGMFEATKKVGVVITGCDIDKTASKIAQLLNPGDKIEAKSFEKLVMETPDDTFDACITNVPFGKARGKHIHDDPAYKNEKYIHRYFISRIIDKLRPGGLAVLVVPIDIVGAKGDNAWEKFRVAISMKAEFLGAHKLPSKTFKSQGTDTVTDVVVFRKHSKEFLDKVESIPFDTLKAANVVWDEFIKGRYWQGEGKPYIMGKYVPKVDGDRWSRETVDGDVDDAGLKAKLAAKFNSRIDWEMVDAAEPITRNYAEGDRKIMNGQEYEFVHGTWQKVVAAAQSESIDAEKYGAATINELKAMLDDPKLCLQLTAEQAFNIWKAFPELMPPLVSQAIEFAMSQPRTELQEQLWRGSIIGGILGRYQASAEAGDGDELERLALQDIVTAEISRYGHPANNKGLSLTGESSRMFGMFRNAIDTKGQFSDLLNGTLEGSGRALEFDSNNLQSIVEHMYLKQNITTITPEDLIGIYTGSKAIATLGDLADCEEIAITPDGLIMPVSRYCAGDIYPKLDAMLQAMATETDPRIIAAYQRQIDLIIQKRKTTELADIDFSLQQKWVPRDMIKQFLKEQGYEARYGSMQTVKGTDPLTGKALDKYEFVEDYNDPFGEWQIAGVSGRGYSKQIDFNKKLSGFDLRLMGYLNGRSITHNLDQTEQDLVTQYREREKALNEGLTAYIQTHPDVEGVVEAFNRKFNSFLPFDYDTSDLKLQGVSDKFTLHTYQNAEVRRLSETGAGGCGFNVGLGKTVTSLALCKYNLQMGRSKRICIVVPSSVLSNWFQEAFGFYSNLDSVLFIGVEPVIEKGVIVMEPELNEAGEPKLDKSGNIVYKPKLRNANSAEEVYSDMWKIPQSNYKIVVMTKDRFKAIPIKHDTVGAYADSMKLALENSKQGQAAMQDAKGKKKGRSYADDVNDAQNDAKFFDEGTEKEKAYPYFEDMGFTDVIYDEAHAAKNLMGASARFSRTAYLPNPIVSQIGMDASIKLHHIRTQNNNRGAYLLTATPITNSLIECYNMLSLVVPQEEFFSRNIYTVDDFINVFGDINPVDKLNTENEIISVEGLTGYKQLDGLRDLFFKYFNVKSAEDVDELRKSLPEADRQDVAVSISSEQQALYNMLRDQGKKSKSRETKKEDKRPLFAILRDMDKVTTDLDLFYNIMTWHFPVSEKAKVDKLVKALPKSVKGKGRPEPGDPGYDYDKNEEQQKIQDIEVKLEKALKQTVQGNVYVLVTPQAYEDSVMDRLKDFGIAEEDLSHPITPKYAALIENCRKEMELGGKQLIFTEEKSQHKKIVRIMVHVIPALRNRIGIINSEEASGNALQQISDAYNSGQLQYVICNRKAEVGVNLQKGTTAIHHLTFPWTKAALIQRDGRGLRQGNTAKKVTIYKYQGAGTFDMYRMDLIEHKGALIDDLVAGKGNRTDNAEADESGMNLMLEDNPEAAKRAMQEKVAAKQAADKERIKNTLLNQFQAYSANAEALANLEIRREEKRKKLTDGIASSEQLIATWREKAQQWHIGDSQRKNYASSIQKEQEKVDKMKGDLAILDIRFDKDKERVEVNVKRAATLLRAKAKTGELPFDASLLDHPENCLIAPDGKTIITVGDMYEIKNYDNGPTWIIKVSSVRNSVEANGVMVPFKGFAYEVIIQGSNYSYDTPGRVKEDDNKLVPLSQFLSKDRTDPAPVKVSYSEKEISLQKALATKIENYSDIVDKIGLDKDSFTEYYDRLKFAYSSFVVRDGTGKISIMYGMPDNRKEAQVVYPEVNSEEFRKAVAEAYLAAMRAGERDYGLQGAMEYVFGKGYKAAVLEYGKKATEAEVLAECERFWNTSLDSHTLRQYLEKGFSIPTSSNLFSATASLGDNTAEIRAYTSSFFDMKQRAVIDTMEMIKAEREQSAMDALRSDPRFKEVPENVKSAFESMGITVKINTANIYVPGFKGRAGTTSDPFTFWLFTDRNGKNGTLFRVKEILKTRYRAAFSQDIGGEFAGHAWWYIPSSVDLGEIYKLMA